MKKRFLINNKFLINNNRIKFISIFFLFIIGFNYNLLNAQNTNNDSVVDNVSKIQQQKLYQINKNVEGREFWLCFMINYFDDFIKKRNRDIDLQLFITGEYDATVTIEFSKIGYKEIIELKGGQVVSVKIDKLAQVTEFGTVESEQAVHITSTQPITVYGLNRRSQTTDTFLGYPVEVLGTEYMVMSYLSFDSKLLSIFSIVATEDNTEVEIIPTVRTSNNKQAGEPFIVTMNKGDVYQCAGMYRPRDPNYSDLTGTTIKSNKKIAVFSGHQCANVPTIQVMACNHLVEQMPPVQTWGKHFYLGKLKMRSKYTYRVLASNDSTRVFCDTALIAVLMKGQYVQRDATEHIQITADKPVLVAQYSPGLAIGDGLGDPMMILVSPTQQFLNKYRFATPVNGNWYHLINVMVPTKAISTFRVNGLPIEKKLFEKLGVSRFSTASIKLSYGSHTVECSQPFGLYSYGFGFGDGTDAYDAYGTMGGQSFIEYEPAIDSIPPVAELFRRNKYGAILLSDDGSDDTGILDITVVEVKNMKVNIPNFVPAAPSVFVDIVPENTNSAGKLILSAKDVARNEVFYTICYVFDNTALEYDYIIQKGSNIECETTETIQLGLFYNLSYNYYSSKFNKTDNINSINKFDGIFNKSGILGVSVSRHLFGKFNGIAKLILQTNNAEFNSIDSIKRFVIDSISNNYVPYFEGYSINIKNLNLNLDLGLDYRISEYFYLSTGVVCRYALSKKAENSKVIFFPPGYVYDNNKYKEIISNELNSISNFNFGIYIGLGFICNIGYRISLFTDINYYYLPFSQLNDADLFLNQINLKIGLKYSL